MGQFPEPHFGTLPDIAGIFFKNIVNLQLALREGLKKLNKKVGF